MSTPPLNWALTPPQQLWAKRTKRKESKNPVSNIYSRATAQHWCKTDTQTDKIELKTYQSVHRHRQLKICHGKGQSASKMVPTKWTATYRSMRLDSCLFSYIKINLKWIKDLNLGSETRKLLEDDAVWAWFSLLIPQEYKQLKKKQTNGSTAKQEAWGSAQTTSRQNRCTNKSTDGTESSHTWSLTDNILP